MLLAAIGTVFAVAAAVFLMWSTFLADKHNTEEHTKTRDEVKDVKEAVTNVQGNVETLAENMTTVQGNVKTLADNMESLTTKVTDGFSQLTEKIETLQQTEAQRTGATVEAVPPDMPSSSIPFGRPATQGSFQLGRAIRASERRVK